MVIWTSPLLKQPIRQQTIKCSIEVARQYRVAIGLGERLHKGAAVPAAVGQSNEDAIGQVLERQEVGGVAESPRAGVAGHGRDITHKV